MHDRLQDPTGYIIIYKYRDASAALNTLIWGRIRFRLEVKIITFTVMMTSALKNTISWKLSHSNVDSKLNFITNNTSSG